jgi:ribonuclease P protein component
MLPKRSRIARSAFAPLLQSRQFKHSPHFTLRFSRDEAIKVPKIAVSVSKKVSKSAVTRNGIRRRAYAALAPLFPPLPAGLYLVVAKSGASEARGERLRAELRSLLKEA